MSGAMEFAPPEAVIWRVADEVDAALASLVSMGIAPGKANTHDPPPLVEILEDCVALSRSLSQYSVEPLRTIHHFSCTGGTLIAKCLAAMPNVLVLNEIDPLSEKTSVTGETLDPDNPVFSPRDLLSLIRQGDPVVGQELQVKVFQDGLRALHKETISAGRRLLLRDHPHSHFLSGDAYEQRPTLLELVRPVAPVLSLVTVRDPIDSYLSMIENGWLDFAPATLDEYAHRYLAFLDRYEGIPIIRYEDFVDRPVEVIREMTAILQLGFSEDFTETFTVFRFSGDSGRKGDRIGRRPRRPIPARVVEELREAPNYLLLIDRLGYPAVQLS